MASTSANSDYRGLNLPHPEPVSPFMRNRATGQTQFEGLPYRGDVRFFKKDDPAHQQPQYRTDVYIKQLRSDEPKELEEWCEILNKVASGQAYISFEEREYNATRQAWDILIRWVEPYYEAPDSEPAKPKPAAKQSADSEPEETESNTDEEDSN